MLLSGRLSSPSSPTLELRFFSFLLIHFSVFVGKKGDGGTFWNPLHLGSSSGSPWLLWLVKVYDGGHNERRGKMLFPVFEPDQPKDLPGIRTREIM